MAIDTGKVMQQPIVSDRASPIDIPDAADEFEQEVEELRSSQAFQQLLTERSADQNRMSLEDLKRSSKNLPPNHERFDRSHCYATLRLTNAVAMRMEAFNITLPESVANALAVYMDDRSNLL